MQLNHKPNIEANEAKYQLLINKRESTHLKYLNDSKNFTEYSNADSNIQY